MYSECFRCSNHYLGISTGNDGFCFMSELLFTMLLFRNAFASDYRRTSDLNSTRNITNNRRMTFLQPIYSPSVIQKLQCNNTLRTNHLSTICHQDLAKIIILAVKIRDADFIRSFAYSQLEKFC